MRVLEITKEVLFLVFKTKPWKKKEFASKQNAIFIRRSLERLGGIFVKFGQMLALRPDFIPPVFCDEFYKLFDQVAPFDQEQVLEVLQSELGDKASLLYKLDTNPIASASFAQVHKAFLEDGSTVAVKIQRPNLDRIILRDLSIVRFLAKTIDTVFQPSSKLIRFVDEFEVWTKDELDFLLEATNSEKFNEVSSLVGDGIRAPKIYRNLTTSKVLTMEFIEGYSLTQIISLLRNGKESQVLDLGFHGDEVVMQLIRNMLEMSHIHGFFHADPHPANIIFTPEKELVMVDFGIVGSLKKKERVLLLRYFRSLLTGNAEESLEALLDLSENKKPENIRQIEGEYRVLIDKFTATFTSDTYLEQQVRSGHILAEMIGLLHNNGVEIPIGTVRYFKTFETVEGLIFALYPKLQIQDMLKEFRRISIINLVDAIPTKLDETTLNTYFLKLINSLEKSLLS